MVRGNFYLDHHWQGLSDTLTIEVYNKVSRGLPRDAHEDTTSLDDIHLESQIRFPWPELSYRKSCASMCVILFGLL